MLPRSREGNSRNRWFDDFVRHSLERDALVLAKVRQRAVLRSLLDRLAGQMAQLLNVPNAMSGLNTTRPTADSYLRGPRQRQKSMLSTRVSVPDSCVSTRRSWRV